MAPWLIRLQLYVVCCVFTLSLLFLFAVSISFHSSGKIVRWAKCHFSPCIELNSITPLPLCVECTGTCLLALVVLFSLLAEFYSIAIKTHFLFSLALLSSVRIPHHRNNCSKLRTSAFGPCLLTILRCNGTRRCEPWPLVRRREGERVSFRGKSMRG